MTKVTLQEVSSDKMMDLLDIGFNCDWNLKYDLPPIPLVLKWFRDVLKMKYTIEWDDSLEGYMQTCYSEDGAFMGGGLYKTYEQAEQSVLTDMIIRVQALKENK